MKKIDVKKRARGKVVTLVAELYLWLLKKKKKKKSSKLRNCETNNDTPDIFPSRRDRVRNRASKKISYREAASVSRLRLVGRIRTLLYGNVSLIQRRDERRLRQRFFQRKELVACNSRRSRLQDCFASNRRQVRAVYVSEECRKD